MNMLKRSLAMVLTVCMLLGVLPFGALAEEVSETAEESAPVVTEETVTVPEAELLSAEKTEEEPGVSPMVSAAEAEAGGEAPMLSATQPTVPDDDTSEGEPFAQGTCGSNSFRIPAMVTLSDGTLVAAADARWNTTYDGGGLDTLVSVSTDGGDTWTASFANYLGDNGNTYNGSGSTCFIDPSLLVTSDDTIYMLVDLYPYGVALNGDTTQTAPKTTVGFNSDGKLLLSNDSHSSYGYYLDGTAIYANDGTVVEDYTVDAYFNLYDASGAYVSNLFFSDSPYKVVRTGFLYLTKSTDKGATWSAPTLLNLKTSGEQVCLVAPGRGLVTSTGMLVFPVYSYNSGDQEMSFIYSNDNGATWTRSYGFTLSDAWSSESAVVELPSGNLRFFYRNGTSQLYWADYNVSGNAWLQYESTGISTNSNCQISAITYSKTIGGNKVVLVSCPTGPSSQGSNQSGASYRLNGKIFAFTVSSSGAMTKVGEISVTSNDNQFMYSCLTELNDGTVAILYEDCESAWGAGDGYYYTMSYAEYDLATAMGLTFDSTSGGETEETEPDVSVDAGETTIKDIVAELVETIENLLAEFVAYDVTLYTEDGSAYTGKATITIPLNGKFDAETELCGFVVEEDGSITYITENVTRDYENDTLTFTAPHFSTVGGTPVTTSEETEEETGLPAAYSGSVTTKTSDASSYWALVTDGVSGIETGKKYLIASGSSGSVRLLSKSGGTSSAVTVTNSQIASADTDYQFTLEGSGSSWTLKDSDGTYLYPTYNNSRYFATGQTTGQAVTISGTSSVTILRTASNRNCYIRYSNSSFSVNQNSSNLYLFEEVSVAGSTYYAVGLTGINTLIAAAPSEQGYYTDETWAAFETALAAANTAISGTASSYTTEADAATQQDAVNAAALALYNAWQNLEVYSKTEITVKYVADSKTVKTETVEVYENETEITLSSVVMGTDGNTYKVGSTTLTLTDATTYEVAVTQVQDTAVSIVQGKSLVQTLDITLTTGQYVVWKSSNTEYVTVGADYASDGSATNHGTIVGQKVTTDDVLVTATVYNADGTVAGIYKYTVTVTEGTSSTNTTTKTIQITVPRIQNCTVYYAINGGELIEITDDMLEEQTDSDGTVYYALKEDYLLNYVHTGAFHIAFFAAPDEGYALTYMSSTNSAGDYYTVSNGNADGTGSSAWPFADGYDPASTEVTIYNRTYSNFDEIVERFNSGISQSGAEGNAIKGSTAVFKTIDGNLHGMRWALLEKNITAAQLKVMYYNALQQGCDGVLVFTKNSQGDNIDSGSSTDADLFTSLQFVAQKLPELDKQIVSITHSNGTTEAYTDGMNIGIGDTINYEIYVYSPVTNSTYGDITYTNIKLVDELTGDTWATTSSQSVSSTNTTTTTIADSVSAVDSFTYVNSAGETITYTGETAKYVYETSLTLGASNFLTVVKDGQIINTADLTYTYNGEYSIGASAFASNAVAEVVVVVPEYVIDFGTTVEIDLTDDPLVEGDKITQAIAKYGYVEITGDRTMKYTPTEILQDAEFITLTFETNTASDSIIGEQTGAIIGYGVRVYPATTIYYEEGFMFWGADETEVWTTNNRWGKNRNQFYSGTWKLTNANKDTALQQTHEIGVVPTGETVFPYGYDSIYDTDSTGSNGSYASTSTLGASTKFTFTGTGFQLFANCEETTGWVTLMSSDGGNVKKLYMVNTAVGAGETGATNQQKGTFYSLPVVSETGLPHGTYTVEIRKTTIPGDNANEEIQIDGLRVFNTVKDSTVFEDDLEDNPEFYQLRDLVLVGLGVSDLTSDVYGDMEGMAGQVYNEKVIPVTEDGEPVAIITDTKVSYGSSTTVQDLLDNGPKNEIYLWKDQTLTFKVQTNRSLQIGLKAPTGATNYTVTVDSTEKLSGSMATSVDMFYELVEGPTDTTKTYTVQVTNTGDNILSITDLKICDDPNAVFVPLTVDDIEHLLTGEPFGTTEDPEIDPSSPDEDEIDPSSPIDPSGPIDPSSPDEDPILPADPKVVRIAGDDRFQTSFAIADELKAQLGVDKFETVIVACAQNFPDALTGSYLAAVKNAPILLVDDKRADAVCTYIAENLEEGGKVYILGGEMAVSHDIEVAIKAMDFIVERLAGEDRYETNLCILREAGVSANQELLICTGSNYADSLSAASTGLPMLLVGKKLTAEQELFLEGHTGKKTIIGGENAVSGAIAKSLGLTAEDRVAGENRYETSVMLAERYFDDVDTVVLAFGEKFPDGLCGGPLAKYLGAPVILTNSKSKNYEIADEYVDGILNGYVLGGQNCINDAAAIDIFDLPSDAVIELSN